MPKYVKAIARRAKAYENVGKKIDSLEGIYVCIIMYATKTIFDSEIKWYFDICTYACNFQITN